MPRPKKATATTAVVEAPVAKVAPKVKIDYPIPVQEPDTTIKAAPVAVRAKRASNRLPDPFDELPEKTRSYLRLSPDYGDNIIIDKKVARGMLKFFENIRELPLPEQVLKELNAHHDLIRKFLGFISVAESDEPWKELLKNEYEPFFANYNCSCYDKKSKKKIK